LKNIVIFASGAGSNAQRIIDHFHGSELGRVALIVSNNPAAGVLNIAKQEGIPNLVITRKHFLQPGGMIKLLQELPADLIVLAGFLRKIPAEMVQAFPEKIVNIHPALLPQYGGSGMYGHHVHDAVIAAGEIKTGITIHYINEHYDEGPPIFRRTVDIDPSDTPQSLAWKVQQLEHDWYPRIIADLLEGKRGKTGDIQ